MLGLSVPLIAWLVTAKTQCGSLDVACTGSNNPMLAGNVAALLAPLALVPIFTLIFGIVSSLPWTVGMKHRSTHTLTPATGQVRLEVDAGDSQRR